MLSKPVSEARPQLLPLGMVEVGLFSFEQKKRGPMENTIVTEETLAEQEQEQRAADQELAEKKQKGSTRLASIVESTQGRDRFARPEADEEAGVEVETEEEVDEEVEETEPEVGEETDEQTGEGSEEETEEEVIETDVVPEAIKTRLAEAFPDEELGDSEKVSEKIASLIQDSENLSTERDANKRVSEVFQNSDEMVQLVRLMDNGKSFFEALAGTVDIEQAMSDLKESDPDEYKKILKQQVEREQRLEAQQAQQEKLQKEFSENEQASQQIIDDFQNDQNLKKEQVDALLGTIDKHFEGLVKGKITPDFLQLVHQGQQFDQAIEAAKEEGRIEGRNEKIQKKKTEKAGDNLPDLKKGGPKKGDKPEPSLGKRVIAGAAVNNRSTFGPRGR